MKKINRLSILISIISIASVLFISFFEFTNIYSGYVNKELRIFQTTQVLSIDFMPELKNIKSLGSPVIINNRLIGYHAVVFDVSGDCCSAVLYERSVLYTYLFAGNNIPLSCFSLNAEEMEYLNGTKELKYTELLYKELFEYRNIPQHLLSSGEIKFQNTIRCIFFLFVIDLFISVIILSIKTEKKLKILFCAGVITNIVILFVAVANSSIFGI